MPAAGRNSTPPVIALATFERILELARAALAGTECLTLTVRHGLGMPLEQWPAGAGLQRES